MTESENKENQSSKISCIAEKTKNRFSSEDKENLQNLPYNTRRISLEETRKRALQPLNDAEIKTSHNQKKPLRKILKRSDIKSDSELYSRENYKNKKLKKKAEPGKKPKAESELIGGSQRVEMSYGDIVAANNKKYSQKFELHKENLPSSQSSMFNHLGMTEFREICLSQLSKLYILYYLIKHHLCPHDILCALYTMLRYIAMEEFDFFKFIFLRYTAIKYITLLIKFTF